MNSASLITTPLSLALVGVPNCGKTALFNRLTGSRQKVANYAGATVERKEGFFVLPSGRHARVLDLPGAYSLNATSPDEAVTRDVCLGQHPAEQQPDLLLCVADATNLRLHLRFVLELKRLGRPMVLALNMADAAARRGIRIDAQALEAILGIPVIETIAIKKKGAANLIAALDGHLPPAPPKLAEDADLHAETRRILAATVSMPSPTSPVDAAIDRWVLHPVLGLAILAAVMLVVFQSVYAWAGPFSDGIEAGVGLLGELAGEHLPEGLLRSLLVDGVIAGVGGVLVFLPQILILFFFILVLEESGYLPRAAFLLDRFMVGAGLSGRAFIPMLSSFACAIPGIMATRSIPDPRDRFLTILVAPMMTCSARLPVYALLIGAFIPDRAIGGVFNLQGLTLFALYMAGIFGALGVAWVARLLGRRGAEEQALMMEIPAWRLPNPLDVLLGLKERGMIFLRRAGTLILALSVLLWFLATFPTPPADWTRPAIEYSFAGHIGRALAIFFEPIGFSWQICVALIPGLAAREVAVAGLASVYAVAGSGEEETAQLLGAAIANEWSLATAFALLAWYVFAPQCLATLSVVRRETASWRATAVWAALLTGLAYGAAFLTFHITAALT
ncbi:ferrous iron transporter B [Uliginosibacterium aquaticum]|uniref:Ferrous iron transport protein B n=1 Tax=Uliginosibacterium aquaticum TaxID=2731212 RepID=A0ABX2IBD4_9RHOO|nr:ferrous iron transporter B [Uliginosibacterium aquaticum]NSL53731.1 ferrous iron transporter B [Uliginosibacterium aquaticum]